MNGQLRRKESPGHALKRVCRRHVGKALASLKSSGQPEAVHNVRKEIKRMRAIFRLARTTLGSKEYRRTAKLMRLAAKPLAAARDARVTKKALESLAGKKAREFYGIKAMLDRHSAHAERSFADNDLASLADFTLKRAGQKLDYLNLNRTGWPDIRTCLKESYTRGRDAYQQAMLKPSPENFHEWRKRVKHLWHQLDFICPNWPKGSKRMVDLLEQLGDKLGDDHDLVLLEQFAKEHCESDNETAELKRLIDARRKEYCAGIKRLGSRLYAELPEKMCAKLEKDWKSWRNGKFIRR